MEKSALISARQMPFPVQAPTVTQTFDLGDYMPWSRLPNGPVTEVVVPIWRRCCVSRQKTQARCQQVDLLPASGFMTNPISLSNKPAADQQSGSRANDALLTSPAPIARMRNGSVARKAPGVAGRARAAKASMLGESNANTPKSPSFSMVFAQTGVVRLPFRADWRRR